jgi:flavorubredoxin
VVVHNVATTDKNDVITDVFRSKGLLVGSPTINRGILHAVAGILEEIKGLRFKNKKAAVFGCYGWSGEAMALLIEELGKAGFQTKAEGLNILWEPDAAAIESAREFGRAFVGA